MALTDLLFQDKIVRSVPISRANTNVNATFGHGYTQTAKRTLVGNVSTWKLTIAPLTQTDRITLRTFILETYLTDPFWYTKPEETVQRQVKYVINTYQDKQIGIDKSGEPLFEVKFSIIEDTV